MDEYKRIHMVGIKGVGMASLAVVLHKMGKHISGTDVPDNFITKELLASFPFQISTSFSAENIPANTDLIITTAAHGGLHNPLVDAARDMGIPILTHAEALGKVMDMYTTRIAVTGTHGKTTTSALLSYVCMKMRLKMAYQVGTSSFSGLPGGDFTGTDYFIAESDEYVASPGIDNRSKFMFQHPTHAICTNIDFDHPDVFTSLEHTKNVFHEFFSRLEQSHGWLVYCYDDEPVRDVASTCKTLTRYSYGVHASADYRITSYGMHDGCATWNVIHNGSQGALVSQLPGMHNASNATAVYALCMELGLPEEEIVEHIATFTGSHRRFEKIYEDSSYVLIDDYAHHPSELRALLSAVRDAYPGRRIVLLFQPHTQSRTRVLFSSFIDAIGMADEAILTDVYASAREGGDEVVDMRDRAKECQTLSGNLAIYAPLSECTSVLKEHATKGDVVITAGAGTIYELHHDIIKHVFNHK